MPAPQPMRRPPGDGGAGPPSAVNPLPASVIALAVIIIGVEALFSLTDRGLLGGGAGFGLRTQAVRDYGFFGEVLYFMLQERQFPPDLVARFVTYPLLHLSFTHALFVCVFILAMGKMVGEALGNAAVLAIFFGASVGGALAYGLLFPAAFPLVGGFPGVYGLIGGYSFLLWVQAQALKQSQLMAFRLVALLLAIQLLVNVLFQGPPDWVADVAGFATGFGLSFAFVPGGWARLRAALRRR